MEPAILLDFGEVVNPRSPKLLVGQLSLRSPTLSSGALVGLLASPFGGDHDVFTPAHASDYERRDGATGRPQPRDRLVAICAN